MEKRKIRNIIIRNLTDEQREHVLSAMRDTGHATASQALMAVCEGYSRMALLCRSSLEEIVRLKGENARLRAGMAGVMEALDRLREISGATTVEIEGSKTNNKI